MAPLLVSLLGRPGRGRVAEMTAGALHPAEVLFAGEGRLPMLAACEHFAGSERLIGKALDFGPMDAKVELVAAALAQGVVPAHNVTLDLRDPEAARADAHRARSELGFLRMWSLPPTQLRPIVTAMAPEPGEVYRAAAVLLAAQHAGWGPIRHEGQLHDRATYRYHFALLERARRSGQALPPAAEEAFFTP